ncbi:MAG: sigma-54 interaction domain-containing protein [Thermodesulfobacteriota bacterium]
MQSIINNYHIILESIEEGVFTVNLDWRIMSFNRAAEKITGISKQNAMGRPCAEVFRTNVCRDDCVLKKTIVTGRPQINIPVTITRADNKKIYISANTAVLKVSSGKVMGGVEIFRDLTALNELQKAYLKQHSFEDIVSKNERMLRYFSILPQIAESDSTVLITGATGTGKELFARAIHNNSLKKNGPFVAVNCGAMPDTLIESELFGYKAGAFTDAKTDKAGRFALAQNGTIFLDEIGDISPALQVRLLRVLQEKTYEPLGATSTMKSNARIIVATHHDLEALVKENKFREDLFYRINVIKISLPPLAERKEDIPLLVDHFIEHFNRTTGKQIIGLSQEAMSAFMMHDWPGNVREMENAIEHAFVLCRCDLIGLEVLPDRFQPQHGAIFMPTGMTLDDIERMAILQALKRNQGKRMATARELNIDKNTLRRKMHRHKIA